MPTPKKGAAALAPKATAGKAAVVKAATRPQPPVRSAPEKTIAVPAVTQGQRIRENVSGVDSIEDAFHQTGRTIRMLEAAAYHAKAHGPVLVIMKDESRVDFVHNCTMFYPDTQVHIKSHNPKLPLFDWNTMEPLADNPQYTGWKVFVDHDVVFSYHRHLFELLGWKINSATSVA